MIAWGSPASSSTIIYHVAETTIGDSERLDVVIWSTTGTPAQCDLEIVAATSGPEESWDEAWDQASEGTEERRDTPLTWPVVGLAADRILGSASSARPRQLASTYG